MDRTSWKPKIFKATESVDYKASEDEGYYCPEFYSGKHEISDEHVNNVCKWCGQDIKMKKGGWANESKANEEDPNPSKMFLDQLQNAGRDGNPSMYWNEEEKQYTNDPLRNVSFDPKAGAPWQKNADLESLASEFEIKDLQEDSKMTDEGFVDKIDMLANKMGVNLDRDPEQVESVANEEEREFYTDRPYNPDEPANDGSYPKCKSCHGWGYIEIPHLGIMDKCGHCGGTGKEPSEKLY